MIFFYDNNINFRDDMIIELYHIIDQDDMIKLNYHNMRYHDHYRLTLTKTLNIHNISTKSPANHPGTMFPRP